MEISFSKIKHSPIDINYSFNNSSVVGTIERINRDCVKLNSNFKSSVDVICNRCGKEYKVDVEYPLELILSDGRYNDKDEIDVVEFFDRKIDFNYLIESEIASIKQDYNYCSSCQDSDKLLEVEF